MTLVHQHPTTAGNHLDTQRRPISPGGRMWDEVGLITFSLTAGTAFLLQTMEPTIAAVLEEHSTFRTDPFGRAERSLASVMMWVYGGEEALTEADRLRRMHAGFDTTDDQGVRHRALSPAPWAWVLLTGIHAFVEGARYFSRRPLTDAEKETYYQENVQLMANFSVAGEEIPASYRDFEECFADAVEHRLVSTAAARDFLAMSKVIPAPPGWPQPLAPLWRVLAGPLGRMQYLATVGTTPAAARRTLGITWTSADERHLRALGWVIARTVPVLPERMRYFPIAYRARRLERDRQRLQRLIESRSR